VQFGLRLLQFSNHASDATVRGRDDLGSGGRRNDFFFTLRDVLLG
jgi:hypothetical protein